MQNQSKYDPSRKTVGAIYRDAQLYGEKQIITGDMNYELKKSLCEDLNDTIKRGTEEFEGKPFYITEYIKRDLQMKNSFVRKMIKTIYRPYPEADTLVFKILPSSNHVFFCWELPPRHEMTNQLACPELFNSDYQKKQLELYRHWENIRLEWFGFMKNEEGNWIANPRYQGDIVCSKDPDEIQVAL